MSELQGQKRFAEDALTDDGFLGGALRVLQPKEGYRAATDPVLLAAAMPARPGQQVLELGCGVGVASLCLARRTGAEVTGIELQPAYADLARRNGARNGLQFDVVQADLSALPAELRARSFDHVMFNPPYFAPRDGTAARDPGREIANREALPLSAWVDTALRRLRPRGWLGVIHLTQRLPDLLRALDERLGSITVLPLSGRQGRAPQRFLLLGRKGGRGPFTLLPPLVTHAGEHHRDEGSQYTPEIDEVLREGKALRILWKN